MQRLEVADEDMQMVLRAVFRMRKQIMRDTAGVENTQIQPLETEAGAEVPGRDGQAGARGRTSLQWGRYFQ